MSNTFVLIDCREDKASSITNKQTTEKAYTDWNEFVKKYKELKIMAKVIRLDNETIGTMVNGQFVFAYDWVVGLPNAETNKVELYNFLSDKTKVDLMDIIKTDFLTYQELEDWAKLCTELEKEYKECLTD